MRISYGEMLRSATEVLRMLGTPYGQADDCAEALLMTHATFGRAYCLVGMADGARRERWSRPVLTRPERGRIDIDLGGAPLLLHAARLADLLCVEADVLPLRVVVDDAIGGWVAPYIALRLARRVDHVSIGWQAKDATGSDEAPDFELTMKPKPAGGHEILAFGIEPIGRTGDGPVKVARGGGAASGGRLLIGMFRDPPAAPERRETGHAVPLELEDHLRQFVRNGMIVDPDDHAFFFSEVAARIRVVSSDRSRSQAG